MERKMKKEGLFKKKKGISVFSISLILFILMLFLLVFVLFGCAKEIKNSENIQNIELNQEYVLLKDSKQNIDTILAKESMPQTLEELVNAFKTYMIFDKEYYNIKEKSKNFLQTMYEKIKNTESVQNITDRYQVWNNKRLKERTDKKINDLKLETSTEEAKITESTQSAEEAKNEADKAKMAIEAAGLTLSPQDEAQQREEIAQYENDAEASREKILTNEMEANRTETISKEFETKIKEGVNGKRTIEEGKQKQ